MECTSKGFLIRLAATVLLTVSMAAGSGCDGKEIRISNTTRLLHAYEEVKEAPLSPLKDAIGQVVEDRLECYVRNTDSQSRIQNCLNDYLRKIVFIARGGIQTVPLVGEFLLCARDCPVIYAMCRGEPREELLQSLKERFIDASLYDDACIARETQCVEICLDKFWRGVRPPSKKADYLIGHFD